MAAHEHPLTDLEQRLLAIAHERGFILPPETDLSRLPAEAGSRIADAPKHSDGMRHFPKKVNKGERPSTYGYPITCADLTAFGRLLASLT
ncbi:hypothetical protein ACFYUV_45720 [Nonomuraea sp. NPDC003560]|uniref:hypothetical protein n=1 Tax=Nonomuraea sp. NPDC003560 TaxID=3364341 RepID=UPI0036C58010